MNDPTFEESGDELGSIRASLDQMAHLRLAAPFSPQEEIEYCNLVAQELQLLDTLGLSTDEGELFGPGPL